MQLFVFVHDRDVRSSVSFLVGLRRHQYFLVWSRKLMPLKWSGFWWLFLKVWWLCPFLIWWAFVCFLLQSCSTLHCLWCLVYFVVDLKLGISEKSIFDEFHPDAQDLFNVTCDLKFVCEKLNDRSQRHKRQVMVLDLICIFLPWIALNVQHFCHPLWPLLFCCIAVCGTHKYDLFIFNWGSKFIVAWCLYAVWTGYRNWEGCKASVSYESSWCFSCLEEG